MKPLKRLLTMILFLCSLKVGQAQIVNPPLSLVRPAETTNNTFRIRQMYEESPGIFIMLIFANTQSSFGRFNFNLPNDSYSIIAKYSVYTGWVWAQQLPGRNATSYICKGNNGDIYYTHTNTAAATNKQGIAIPSGQYFAKVNCAGQWQYAKALPGLEALSVPFINFDNDKIYITCLYRGTVRLTPSVSYTNVSVRSGFIMCLNVYGDYLWSSNVSNTQQQAAISLDHIWPIGRGRIACFGRSSGGPAIAGSGLMMSADTLSILIYDSLGRCSRVKSFAAAGNSTTGIARTMYNPLVDSSSNIGYLIQHGNRLWTPDTILTSNRTGTFAHLTIDSSLNIITALDNSTNTGNAMSRMYSSQSSKRVTGDSFLSDSTERLGTFRPRKSFWRGAPHNRTSHYAVVFDKNGRVVQARDSLLMPGSGHMFMTAYGTLCGFINVPADTVLEGLPIGRGMQFVAYGPLLCPKPNPARLVYDRTDTTLRLRGLDGPCTRIRYLRGGQLLGGGDTTATLELTLPRDTGWYQVRLTAQAGCDTLTNLVYVSDTGAVITSLSGPAPGARPRPPALTLHPNPAQESVTLEYPPGRRGDPISLLAADGRVALKARSEGPATTLDLRALPKGVYTVLYRDRTGLITRSRLTLE